jgi:uncharacterized membrane protein
MKYIHILPIILIVIDILASIVYLINKDYARTGYWLMAAGLTFFTLLIK